MESLGFIIVRVCLLAKAVGALSALQQFKYTKCPQSYTVPAGVSFLQVDACGARGGNGGNGGFISAIISVSPGQQLWIYVGGGFDGQPADANDFGYLKGPGDAIYIKGYNGGGYGGYTNLGGGGTDIRTQDGGKDGSQNVQSRLVVAGGGGGYVYGGAGGGVLGQVGLSTPLPETVALWSFNPKLNGGGGSQVSGGLGSTECTSTKYDKNGALWQGGACVNGYDGGGPGGGGGYYGGGSGGNQYGGIGGGGGGSSFCTPTGIVLKNVVGQCKGPHGSLNITVSSSLPAITYVEDGVKLCEFFRALYSSGTVTGWCEESSPFDPCAGNWTGVECGKINGSLRVISLTLAGRGLSGTLSPSLGGLGELTALNVSGNSLGGSLPSELGALTRLEILALNNNNFTAAVPDSFCRLDNSIDLTLQSNPHLFCWPVCLLATTAAFPKLQRDATSKQCGSAADDGKALCSLNSNAPQYSPWKDWCSSKPPYDPCSGNWVYVTCARVAGVQRVTALVWPNENGGQPSAAGGLGQLSALTTLEIRFSQQIPTGLWSLLSLRKLVLSSYSTGTLSSLIGNLAALSYLDLHWSYFTGTIPTTLWSLVNLQYLDLSQTNGMEQTASRKLSGELSTLLGSLSSLTYLNIGATLIGGTIPTTLWSLVNLRGLFLAGNTQFAGQQLPSSISRLTNLIKCDLSGSRLVGTLPSSIGNLSASLQELNLYKNSLTGPLPSSIGQLKSLLYLNLLDNSLSGAIPSEICKLSKRLQIDLRRNAFACTPKCLNSLNFPYNLNLDISGTCTLPPSPFPTSVPTMPPTGTGADFQRQTTLSRFTVTQQFTCIGNAATCVSAALYAPILQSVNFELWMAYANQKTRWLTADMLTSAVSAKFNPNMGSDAHGYLLSYDVFFRPADLQMSNMAAVQASFKEAIAGVGVVGYTKALTVARKASSRNALSDLLTLNCTSIDVGEAVPAPPTAQSATDLPTSPLLQLINSAPLELGLVALVALVYSILVYFLRRGVQLQNEGIVVAFKHFEFVIPFVLSISAAASNILQIRTYLGSPTTTDIAAVMIASRVGVALYSALLLTLTLTRPSYSKHLVGTLLHKGFLWVLVAFAALLDPTHLRYFPWKCTDFAERSRGFPTLRFFKVAMGCTAANSLVQLSVSVVRGVQSFSSISSLVLSLGLFLSTMFTIVVKLVAEKIHEHDLTLLPVASSLEGALKMIAVKDDEIAALQEEIAKLRCGGDRTSLSSFGSHGIAMVSRGTAATNSSAATSTATTTITNARQRLNAFFDASEVYSPAHVDNHAPSRTTVEPDVGQG